MVKYINLLIKSIGEGKEQGKGGKGRVKGCKGRERKQTRMEKKG